MGVIAGLFLVGAARHPSDLGACTNDGELPGPREPDDPRLK